MLATVILLAVMHRQDHFAIFRRHAHQRGAPHPEQRARAAEEDRRGHTGDVAGTDRRGQAGHQRLERTDLARFFVAFRASAPDQCEAGADTRQRHELEHRHQEETGAQNQHQHGRAPDETVNAIDQVLQEFHSRHPY